MTIKVNIQFIITTVLSVVAILVYFISPPTQKPSKKLMTIEFNRIASSGTLPLLFKMMEGAHLVEDPGFGGQYNLRDDKGNIHGQVVPEFKSMWDKWYFKDVKPLNNTLWQYVSGSGSINDFIGFLNVKAKTDDIAKLEGYAKHYMCFYHDSVLNEDGEGWIGSSVSEKLYNLDIFNLCELIDADAYSFYYTAVVLSNMSDKPMHNIRIHIKDIVPSSDSIKGDRKEYYSSLIRDTSKSKCKKTSLNNGSVK